MVHPLKNYSQTQRSFLPTIQKKYLQIAGLCFLLLSTSSLLGCAQMAAQEGRETLTKMTSKWQVLNEKMALSLGQKTFQATKKELLQAIVTGFPTINISILNMNKEMGFLVGEGSGIISANKEKEIFEKEVLPEYEKESTLLTWNYTPGNYTVRINVNLFEKKQGLLVKMRLSNKTTSRAQNVSHSIPTPLLREHYRTLWEVIDKSLFMQKETS